MVSVVIISYNEAEYLKQAIDSCLKQTYDNIEIIIGDDGSTDSSMEIINHYVKCYPEKIKSFIMERNVDLARGGGNSFYTSFKYYKKRTFHDNWGVCGYFVGR